MAVTLNASTSSGLVQTADTSGEIELQSNGTTALKVNTNEGIQILNCLGVGNVTPSTSGAGITFPATQSASSDANTLDDYEEGTWTPSIGGTATYYAQEGKYTKIGNLVIASFDLNVNQRGTGSTTDISGLPFAAGSSNPAGIVCPVSYWASTATAINWLAFRVDATASSLSNAFTTGTQVTSTANGTIFQNSTRVIGTVSYFA